MTRLNRPKRFEHPTRCPRSCRNGSALLITIIAATLISIATLAINRMARSTAINQRSVLGGIDSTGRLHLGAWKIDEVRRLTAAGIDPVVAQASVSIEFGGG